MSLFSNGTEFDCFLDRNCSACVHDGTVGAGPDEAQCSLLDDVFLEPDADPPPVWIETGFIYRYDCKKRETR